MPGTLVLTVIAPDRPGLVGRLSDTIAAHGGNWEASRMARLAGRFAGILRVTVAPDRAEELENALAALASDGLKVSVDRGESQADPAGKRYRLALVGNDRPGIIRRVSGVLVERAANVIELSSNCRSAPMAGGTLFELHAELVLAENDSIDAMRTQLEAVANDLMVDLSVLDSDS